MHTQAQAGPEGQGDQERKKALVRTVTAAKAVAVTTGVHQ